MGVASLAKAGLLAVLLVAWQLLWMWGMPSYILSPLQIVTAFFAALGSQELYVHAGTAAAKRRRLQDRA